MDNGTLGIPNAEADTEGSDDFLAGLGKRMYGTPPPQPVPVYRDSYAPEPQHVWRGRPWRPVAKRIGDWLVCAMLVALVAVLTAAGLLLAQRSGLTAWPHHSKAASPSPVVTHKHHHHKVTR